MINIGSKLVCIDDKTETFQYLKEGATYKAVEFSSCCIVVVNVGITPKEENHHTICQWCGRNFGFGVLYFNLARFAELESFQQSEVNELVKEAFEKQPFAI